jgi:hypothetical protein
MIIWLSKIVWNGRRIFWGLVGDTRQNTFNASDDETDDDSYNEDEIDLNVKKAARDVEKKDEHDFERLELVSGDEEHL